MEEWRDVVGYEGLYMVSNEGRVKSLARVTVRKNGSPLPVKGRVMSPCLNTTGYYVVYIGYKKTEVHRLVAPAFLGVREKGKDIDHIDQNKLNNAVSNLRYVSRSENVRNCKRYEKKKSSYAGVSLCPGGKKWRARVWWGRECHLGSFASERDAAIAYDKFCRENNLDRGLNNA